MFRAVGAGTVVLALALSGCSSGGADALGASKACPLLTQLAETGHTVARADVSDPATFDHTIRDATTEYVRIARRLRDAVVRRGEWEEPRIFAEIQAAGDVTDDEMAHVFNLGLGMLAVVAPRDRFATLDVVRAAGQEAWIVGEVSEGRGRVSITQK